MAEVNTNVNVDVNLNTDNALHGLEKLDSEAEKVKLEAKDISNLLSEFKRVEQSLTAIQNRLKNVNTNMKLGQSAEATSNQTTALSELAFQITDVAKKYKELKDSSEGLSDYKIKKFTKESDSEFIKMLSTFEKLDFKLASLPGTFSSMTDVFSRGMSEFSNELFESGKSIQLLISELLGLSKYTDASMFTENYSLISSSIKNITEKLSNLKGAYGTTFESDTFLEQRKSLQELMVELDKAQQTLIDFISIEKSLNQDGLIHESSAKRIKDINNDISRLAKSIGGLDLNLYDSLGLSEAGVATLGESFDSEKFTESAKSVVDSLNERFRATGSGVEVPYVFDEREISEAENFNSLIEQRSNLVKELSNNVREYNMEKVNFSTEEGQPGMSTEQALSELEASLTDEQRKRIALSEQARLLQRQEEEGVKNTAAAFRQKLSEMDAVNSKQREFEAAIDREIAKEELLHQTAESFNNELAKAGKDASIELETDDINTEIEKLKSDFEELDKTYEEMFKTGDFSGLNSASNKLDELNRKGEELNNRIINLGNQRWSNGMSVDTSQLSESLRNVNTYAEGIVNNISDNMRTHILDKTKKGISTISKIAKDSFKSTFNVANKAVSTYFNTLRSMFSSLFGWVKSKVSKIFSGKEAASGLSSELKSLLGVAGITTLIKESIDLASSMLEVQNVTDSVFKSLSSDIDDFTENAVQKFGLTQLKAKEMIGVFGGMLGSSNVVGEAQAEMSKNLTALAGDVASFYNMDTEAAFKKLQSGLAGNTAAMRTLGVNMTIANLEAFALSRGITTSYREMNQATKTTLRYNYMLNQLAVAQGDFSRTSYTWANQVRLLKNSFSQLFSILGGAVVKFLLPVVQILNQIVAAAINVANALAKAFGFSGIDLKEFAGSTGAALPEIEDTTEALDNESDALDKAGKSAKKASENLQSFDKLNNITSETASGSGGAGGIGGAGGSGSLIDFDSYYDKVDDITEDNKLQQWLEDLYSLMADDKWKEAGQKIASALNSITDSAYDWLTATERHEDIKKFNKAITDFADGLLEYDFKNLGKTVGAGINLITFAINDLYEQASKKDLLTKAGKKIADFFDGLVTETKWDDVGKAATTGFRAAMDTLAGFIEEAKDLDLGTKVGNAIKDFLKGAIERLFGNDGDKEIGSNIAGLMNLAFESFATAFGKDENDTSVVDEVADGVLNVINTAIEGIDENDLADALTALLNVIGTLFGMLGDIDTDTLSDKIAHAVNTAVDDGSVENATSGIASAILNLFNLIGKTIDKVDKSSLGSAIIKGISDGLNTTDGEGYLVNAFSILFGVKLLGSVGKFGLGLLGNSIIKALSGSFTGNAAVSTTVGSMSSIFTVQNAAKFGLKGAILAMAVSLGKTLVDGVKSGIDQTVATEDILAGMRDDLKGTITLSVDPNAYTNLTDYRNKLSELKSTYDNIATLVDDISFGEDNLTSIKDLTAYLDKLEKAGAGGSTQFKNLKKAIDDYNNASILDKSAAFDNVYSLAQDLSLEFEATVETIDSLNDVQFDALDSNFSKLKQNTKFSEDEVNELTLTWSNAGEQLSKGLLDKVTETVDNDSTVDTSVKDLVSDATADSNTSAKSKGKGVAANLTAGVTKALYDDITVASATSSLVTDATSESNTLAKSKGKGVASDITSGVKSKLDEDTTAKGAMSSLVRDATSNENTKANEKGKSVGGGITFGIKSKLDKDTTAKGAVSSLVKDATSNENTKADSNGKNIGGYIIDGVKVGIDNPEKRRGLFSSVKNLVSDIVNLFTSKKDGIDSHSPSKLFAHLASYIPSGIAVGIKSNTKVATKAIGNMCSSISSKFENTNLNTNSLISVGKFDGMYESLMRQTDTAYDYVANKFDNLRDMINLQSSLVVNPSVSRANLEAAYASASDVSGVVKSVGNIYSKLATSNLGSSNKPVQVNIYLDKNNKLSSYIINTVNGNITKTGNF